MSFVGCSATCALNRVMTMMMVSLALAAEAGLGGRRQEGFLRIFSSIISEFRPQTNGDASSDGYDGAFVATGVISSTGGVNQKLKQN